MDLFGRPLKAPKLIKQKPHNIPNDFGMPSIEPYQYGHRGRALNSDYNRQMLLYKQRCEADYNTRTGKECDKYKNEQVSMKYNEHARLKRLKKSIEERTQQKLLIFEQALNERRKKLLDLLTREEQLHYYEVVDSAQRGKDTKLAEMKAKADALSAKREAERQEIVRQKRIEQFRDRCMLLRPVVKQRLIDETKFVQLQQIRENEARREADREIDMLYHQLMLKNDEAKTKREEQDTIKNYKDTKDLMETWDKQILGKQMALEEEQRIIEEDQIENDKVRMKMELEERTEQDIKRKKRELVSEGLLTQLREQREIKKKRKEEEDALVEAFAKLNKMELEKEKNQLVSSEGQMRKEAAMYKQHLLELQKEREEEEKELEVMLEQHAAAVMAKEMEERCKIFKAKEKLKEETKQGVLDQLKFKKEKEANDLRMKEMEDELMRLRMETCEKLYEEQKRMEEEAQQKYREDLRKQMEYNEILRQRERDETQRQYEAGIAEEKKFQELVTEMMQGKIEAGTKHPFRTVLERYDCHCLENMPPHPF